MNAPTSGVNDLMAQAAAAERAPEATSEAQPNAPRAFPTGTGVSPSPQA